MRLRPCINIASVVRQKVCVSAEMKTSDWTRKETNSDSRERERVEAIGPTWRSKGRVCRLLVERDLGVFRKCVN